MYKCTFNFIGMLCASFLLVACASSHKTSSNVSSEKVVSSSLAISDSLTFFEVRQGSTVVVKSDSSLVKQCIQENGIDDETITEHITETIDVSGNRTTTIDRTSNRTGNYYRQTNTDRLHKYQEEQMTKLVDSLDSVVNSWTNAYKVHWAKTDSLKSEKEKNTSDIRHRSIRSRVWTMLVLFVMLVVLSLYILNKKK